MKGKKKRCLGIATFDIKTEPNSRSAWKQASCFIRADAGMWKQIGWPLDFDRDANFSCSDCGLLTHSLSNARRAEFTP